jgi:hypothetical protein
MQSMLVKPGQSQSTVNVSLYASETGHGNPPPGGPPNSRVIEFADQRLDLDNGFADRPNHDGSSPSPVITLVPGTTYATNADFASGGIMGQFLTSVNNYIGGFAIHTLGWDALTHNMPGGVTTDEVRHDVLYLNGPTNSFDFGWNAEARDGTPMFQVYMLNALGNGSHFIHNLRLDVREAAFTHSGLELNMSADVDAANLASFNALKHDLEAIANAADGGFTIENITVRP